MALFESYERRINQINVALNKYGIASLEEAKKICEFIKEVIGIANFWEKNDEVKALSDRIASRLRMGGLRTVIDNKDELTAQIMSICKSNYTELLRKIDDLA